MKLLNNGQNNPVTKARKLYTVGGMKMAQATKSPLNTKQEACASTYYRLAKGSLNQRTYPLRHFLP